MNEKLFERSPIRAFEKVTDGGLKAGELGLITSKKGLGKTSVLVQFGMDTLLQDKQLVHVTFDQHSSNVISWYESIFTEIAKKKNIGNAKELLGEVVRNRTILNFNQESFSLTKVAGTLKALKAAGIEVAGVVADGLDLSKVSTDDLKAFADYAKESGLGIWLSSNADGDNLSDSVSKELADYFAIVAHLAAKADGVQLSILKLRNAGEQSVSLKLESKTSLITER